MITTEQYWMSQDPDVRVLYEMWKKASLDRPDFWEHRPAAEIVTKAQELAAAGHVIDAPIMVQGSAGIPDVIMEQREIAGWLWVPAANQPWPPDLNLLRQLPIPPGAIKVSRDPADYPAFMIPHDPSWATNPVGFHYLWDTLYWPSTYPKDDGWPVGETYADRRGAFVKVKVRVGLGDSFMWEKVD